MLKLSFLSFHGFLELIFFLPCCLEFFPKVLSGSLVGLNLELVHVDQVFIEHWMVMMGFVVEDEFLLGDGLISMGDF
jgi:hypothetical protein